MGLGGTFSGGIYVGVSVPHYMPSIVNFRISYFKNSRFVWAFSINSFELLIFVMIFFHFLNIDNIINWRVNNLQKTVTIFINLSLKSEINNGKWSVDRAGNISVLLTNFSRQLKMKIYNQRSINPVEWLCLNLKFRILGFLILQIPKLSFISTNFAMYFFFRSGLPLLASNFELEKILKSPTKIMRVFWVISDFLNRF